MLNTCVKCGLSQKWVKAPNTVNQCVYVLMSTTAVHELLRDQRGGWKVQADSPCCHLHEVQGLAEERKRKGKNKESQDKRERQAAGCVCFFFSFCDGPGISTFPCLQLSPFCLLLRANFSLLFSVC